MYSKRPVDYLNEIAVQHGIDHGDAFRMMVDDATPASVVSAVPDRKSYAPGYGMNASMRESLDAPDSMADEVDASSEMNANSASTPNKEQRRTYMTIEFVRNVDGDYRTEKVCGYLPDDDVLRDPLIVDFLQINITEGGVTKLMLIPRRNINTVRVYDAND